MARFKLNISVDGTGSQIRAAVSSDERTLDGLNPHCLLIDELHKHKTRALLDVLDTALGARRQPLLWIITTAGDDSPERLRAGERLRHQGARRHHRGRRHLRLHRHHRQGRPLGRSGGVGKGQSQPRHQSSSSTTSNGRPTRRRSRRRRWPHSSGCASTSGRRRPSAPSTWRSGRRTAASGSTRTS